MRLPLITTQLLTQLNDSDPAQERAEFEVALATLAAQVAAGEPEAEEAWTAVFERLANFCFANDTPALLELVAGAEKLGLVTAVACQTRQFFQGVAAFRQDRYDAALTLFDELLTHPDLPTRLRARALNARAVVCRLTGRLEEAMAGYQASLVLWQELGDDHYQGIVYLNLGIIAYGLRQYETAVAHLHQAERFFQAAGSTAWLRKVQSELGLVQRDLGNWAAALRYFDAYVAQSQAAGATEDVGVGEANRGEVLLFQGDLAGAKEALQRAMRLLPSRAYRVDHLLHLGLAYQAEGDLGAAEGFYRQGLALGQEIGRREILPHAHYHLGEVLRRQGQAVAALEAFAQAAAIIQETRQPLRDEGLKISLLGRWQQVYEALVLHNLTLGRDEAAFAWAERARARAFAEGLGSAEAGEEAGVDDRVVETVQAALPPDTTMLCYFTTGVLEQDMPLLRAIPADNPLRDYLLLPPRILLFAVTRDRLTVHDCPLDPNLFATRSPRGFAVRRFLQTAVLHRLQRDLLPPLPPPHFTLRTPPARLLLIPHGPLHRVPFTALLHQAAGPVIGYAPSGTIFAQQQQAERPSSSGCLAVGYNSGVGNGRFLPYTEAEVQRVAGLMGGQAWTGPEPKKARLREAAAACRWLHIACHAWFDDADPLASYLETGAGERLTAREVLADWRLEAELVTLSACETGVSQILRGDEPLGLVRAFLFAGAQAVLVTQWPVDDLATYFLMGRFYELVGSEKTADIPLLLHQAQSWLQQLTVTEAQAILGRSAIQPPAAWAGLSAADTPYAAPEFWAGFILVGNMVHPFYD